jgi:hypothetical protein
MPMHGQTLFTFPALDGAHTSSQENGNLLPGIKNLFGWAHVSTALITIFSGRCNELNIVNMASDVERLTAFHYELVRGLDAEIR